MASPQEKFNEARQKVKKEWDAIAVKTEYVYTDEFIDTLAHASVASSINPKFLNAQSDSLRLKLYARFKFIRNEVPDKPSGMFDIKTKYKFNEYEAYTSVTPAPTPESAQKEYIQLFNDYFAEQGYDTKTYSIVPK